MPTKSQFNKQTFLKITINIGKTTSNIQSQKRVNMVRSAKGTPMEVLLKGINEKILRPYDKILPKYIFGSVAGKNHIDAARFLLGEKRNRTLLHLDISKFFDQITEERVFYFFYSKAGCSKTGARLLARLCCVPEGSKDNPGTNKTIARGFSTSSRLAIWCTLDLVIKINNIAYKKLKGYDPRFSIYVDDIGITASRVSKQQMKTLAQKIEEALLHYDKNQSLPINIQKTKIESYDEKGWIEYLGLKIRRSQVDVGSDTQIKD